MPMGQVELPPWWYCMERTDGKGALISHGQVYILLFYTRPTCMIGSHDLREPIGAVSYQQKKKTNRSCPTVGQSGSDG